MLHRYSQNAVLKTKPTAISLVRKHKQVHVLRLPRLLEAGTARTGGAEGHHAGQGLKGGGPECRLHNHMVAKDL